jgi:hypothetical protein
LKILIHSIVDQHYKSWHAASEAEHHHVSVLTVSRVVALYVQSPVLGLKCSNMITFTASTSPVQQWDLRARLQRQRAAIVLLSAAGGVVWR